MFERMLNKEQKPDLNAMTKYCGKCAELFTELNNYLTDNAKTITEIRFPYGKSYGWSVCHRIGKNLFCDVFPESGSFCVMLRLSNKSFESIYNNLSDYAKSYVDNKYPCGSGGWIHYRVSEPAHLNDIIQLTETKAGEMKKKNAK